MASSKVAVRSTKKDKDAAKYVCTRCGRTFARQRGYFPASHSPIFAKNNGYLCVCAECVDSMFEQYSRDLGGDANAARRICMKFDIYWNFELFDALKKLSPSGSQIRSYISKLNLYKYTGKTFDHTLSEEAAAEAEAKRAAKEREAELATQSNVADSTEVERGYRMDDVLPPTEETIRFWGEGYTWAEYRELQERFERWTDGVPTQDLGAGAETLYRQICVLELIIKKNANAGKPIEQAVNQLNNLIGSVNAKPTQIAKTDDSDDTFDGLPIGVGIRIYENSEPIPRPRPEYQDCDGIIRYVLIWVFGHLCKLFHIKNAYSKLYEEEMERLRVERPDIADEDDEDLIYDVFGDLKREGNN